MKKLFLNVLAIALLTSTFISCDILGMNDAAMDSEEVATKVKEAVTKNVDATKWKIYEITWAEGEELGNKLSSINLTLVNKDGDYFTQKIDLNNKHEFVAEEVKEPTIPESARSKIVYDEVVGIDCSKLDGKAIVKQIEAVKTLIPAEYEFKSVKSYNIEEDVHRIDHMDKLRSNFNKKGKKYGEQSTSITLNVLKKGEGTQMEGRHITTNYYSIPFVMKEDGSWEIEE